MHEIKYEHWPVIGSGLSERIVNCCQSACITTVGQLRNTPAEKLLKIRNFGTASLHELQSYLEILEQASLAEKDSQAVSLCDIFNLFLDEDQQFVLTLRYGLDEQIEHVSRKHTSLQNAANQSGRTRERIRQVEEAALKKLASRGAQYCLLPYYRYFRDTLNNTLNGTADLDETIKAFPLSRTGNRHPASLMLLLFDLNPAFFSFRDGLFSTLTTEQLAQLEQALVCSLKAIDHPVPAESLLEIITAHDLALSCSRQTILKTIIKLTERNHDLGLSREDFLCFHYVSALSAILLQILENSESQNLHYKEITRIFNEYVVSASRKGCGFILKALQGPVFIQKSSAVYGMVKRTDS